MFGYENVDIPYIFCRHNYNAGINSIERLKTIILIERKTFLYLEFEFKIILIYINYTNKIIWMNLYFNKEIFASLYL